MADGTMSPRSMLDLATLASSLGKTKRAVEIRAKREGWAFEEKATRGGRRRLYAVDALPPDAAQRPKVRTTDQPS